MGKKKDKKKKDKLKALAPKGCKTKCCKKYRKSEKKRCKRCPCFDLMTKAA